MGGGRNRPENRGVPRNLACEDPLLRDFPFHTFGAPAEPASLREAHSPEHPAGSYWYVAFGGSPGSTSRDKSNVTAHGTAAQGAFREMSRLLTNGYTINTNGSNSRIRGFTRTRTVASTRHRAFASFHGRRTSALVTPKTPRPHPPPPYSARCATRSTIRTTPAEPSTSTMSPVAISVVARPTFTTPGMPYSRAMMLP